MPASAIAAYVRTVLEERARHYLLTKHEDWYYGWVPARLDQPTNPRVAPLRGEYRDPSAAGHWLGERVKVAAAQALHDAQDRLDRVSDDNPRARRHAERDVTMAQLRYDNVLARIEQAVERRREDQVRKAITRLFRKTYEKARHSLWPVYHPGIPADVRAYVLQWKDEPHLTPTSLVFLWLLLEECQAHGDTFSLQGFGHADWLATLPIIQAGLDTDATDPTSRSARRDYVRQLQRRDTAPTHANHDPRDARPYEPYDGADDTDRCPTCGGVQRLRVIEVAGRVAEALACDAWATTCRYETTTPFFSDRTRLHDHQVIETLLTL